MAGAITSQELETWKILLREGRVQEADNQINAAQEALKRAEQEEKLKKPAGEPMTDDELNFAVLDEIDRLQGYPPRLHALMIELYGRHHKPKE